jgi:FkbM family methyltransferase
MFRSAAYYMRRIHQDGLPAILRRRLWWYWSRIRINNRTVGRIVELMGNRIRVEGMVFSVDSPMIETSHKSTLFFGLHEIEERALLDRWIPATLPVVELGGGLGVVACLTNRKLVRREEHIVVEANPGLAVVLERNRDLNGCRFQVVNKALANEAEAVEFSINSSFVSSRIGASSAETVSVPATSLKVIADASRFDQFSLVCDIEGAEGALVEREIATLRQRVRFFLVEIHPRYLGTEGVSRMVHALEGAGFTLRDRSGDNWVFTRE